MVKYEIIYFSGTGGTKLAAEKLRDKLYEKGNSCIITDISTSNPSEIISDSIMIIVMYPVYAGIPPRIMRKFLSGLKLAENLKDAAVISVSGGGEVPFNKSSRFDAIRILNSKNYSIIYEDMIIMPSNWAMKTADDVSLMLINVMDEKADRISNTLTEISVGNFDLIAQSGNNTENKRVIRTFGRVAGKLGFPIIGRIMKPNKNCSGCSICANNCPSANINIVNGKPRFGWKCNLCMRCIYGCPEEAIKAGPFNFMILKDGYDISKMEILAEKSKENQLINRDEPGINGPDVIKYIEELK